MKNRGSDICNVVAQIAHQKTVAFMLRYSSIYLWRSYYALQRAKAVRFISKRILLINDHSFSRLSYIKSLTIFFYIILVQGCATKPAPTKIELLLPGQIFFQSEISPDSVDALMTLAESSPVPIHTLVVDSGGGEVMSGLRLGEFVHNNNIRVIVRDYCASSCANYVLTGSPEVLVEKGALIGWHGGALQAIYRPQFGGISMQNPDARDMIIEWQDKEAKFFEKVGVNQIVTVLGMMPQVNKIRDASLFSYDAETLKAMGLNIEFEDIQLERAGNGKKYVQIFRLDDLVLNDLITFHKTVMIEFEKKLRKK